MTNEATQLHLDDAALVRLLDGERDDAGAAGPQSHLQSCDACQSRHAELARRSSTFSALLAATDAAPRSITFNPARRQARPAWSTARLRAAAVAGIVLAGAFTVSPVRAWITGAASALWHAVAGSDVEEAPLAPAPDQPLATSGTVAFTVQGSRFTVRVATLQAAGSLVLEGTAGVASASLEEGAGSAELVVLPDGLRIENTAETGRGYRVRLPETLERIQVIVGSGQAITVPALAAGESRVINLQRR